MQPSVPRILLDMPVRLHHIVIDAHDLPGLARFWTRALGWKVLSERENEIVIGTDENAPVGMCFMPVTDPKTVKNRVHLDLTSSAADRDQEIDRLLALGARRVDIGQTGGESWTVLADPEGNEFCVVRPKETLIREGVNTENRRQTCPRQKSKFGAPGASELEDRQRSAYACGRRFLWMVLAEQTTNRPSPPLCGTAILACRKAAQPDMGQNTSSEAGLTVEAIAA